MKSLTKPLFLLLIYLLPSCTEEPSLNNCVKGKYLGTYCGEAIVQILDGTKIGQDWAGMNGEDFRNCIASPRLAESFIVPSDSIVYFKYKEGPSGRNDFKTCFPEPFTYINITGIYSTPCTKIDD